MSEWIEWKGGECPVGSECKVEVLLSGALETYEFMAWELNWNNSGGIIKYRVISEDQEKQSVPESDGWIKWEGGECPVNTDVMVEVMFRDDLIGVKRAGGHYWHHNGDDWDIVAYRIVQKTEQEIETNLEQQEQTPITSQPYYMLFPEQNIQVKDVNEAFCTKHDALENKVFNSHEMAWIVQGLQYIFRSPFKEDALQDLSKAVVALNIVIDSMKQRQKT